MQCPVGSDHRPRSYYRDRHGILSIQTDLGEKAEEERMKNPGRMTHGPALRSAPALKSSAGLRYGRGHESWMFIKYQFPGPNHMSAAQIKSTKGKGIRGGGIGS